MLRFVIQKVHTFLFMREYNWDDFRIEDYNCYAIYMYLVTTHLLSIEIMKTLIHFRVCESEAIVFNRTMIKLLVLLRKRKYAGSTHEFEDDAYRGNYKKKDQLVSMVDLFLRGHGLIIDILSKKPNIRYVWIRGYFITRNNQPILFKKFLNTIKKDLH